MDADQQGGGDAKENGSSAPSSASAAAASSSSAADAKGGEHLSLKVKSQDGNEVFFKVKKTTTFSKVMTAYCKKVGADMDSVRFLFDGQRLRAEQTPADLDMEDEDEIDAMVQQTGGAGEGARGGGRTTATQQH